MRLHLPHHRVALWGGLELLLLVLALIFAVWTADSVQQNADAGLQRWQSDVANSDLQLDRQRWPALTTTWCQNDPDALLPEGFDILTADKAAGLLAASALEAVG